MRSRCGLSLIELLVVVGVVGILVGIGSGVRGFLDRGRLNEAVNTLEHQVQEGRRLAKRLDTDVTVSVTEDAGAWVVDVNGRAHSLGRGVTVSPPSGFDLELNPPFGTYAGQDIAVNLSVGSASTSVTVTGVLTRVVRP